MDHPLRPYSSWRTRALIAAAVAALELVALVTVAAVLAGRSLAGHVQSAARAHELAPLVRTTKREPGDAPPLLERTETSVVVLNGNGISGAAAVSAAKVRAHKYVVTNVGNAPRENYGRTVVMYRPGFQREAQRLAKDVGVKLVGPLDGLRAPDLMGAHIALVVGR